MGKKIGNKGAVVGAVVATVPDLDVVLMPFYSDLERLSIHRGYSHSILFSLLGAFLFAYILSRIKWTQQISKTRLWIFAWLALITHILLDAFTTYGTLLFLPVSDYRVGFDSINVVDPVYTLPMLAGLVFSLFIYKDSPSRTGFNKAGLIISTLYLLGTLGIKFHVEQQFDAELKKQNIVYRDLLTVPVSIGSINWYGVAKTGDGLYMAKYSNLKRNQIHFEFFPTNEQLLDGLDPWLVNRMKWFAKGFYTVSESGGNIRLYNLQVDMRGIRQLENGKAPTAGYFEIIPQPDGSYKLSYGTHP